MKKTILLFLLVLGCKLNAQTYSYTLPKNIMSGVPGDVFNGSVTFSNTSASVISLFLNRYVVGLPPNWHSCYCYIQCNSYLRDTLTIQVQPFSTEIVTLQFRTDSVNPGVAASKFRVYQLGFQNNNDTFQLNANTVGATAIKELSKITENVILFPNPANDNINLFKSNETIKQINIYDYAGGLVHNYLFEMGNQNINISDLQKGLYMIEVSTEKNRYKKVFIKN